MYSSHPFLHSVKFLLEVCSCLVHFTCHFWDPLVNFQCHFSFTLCQILIGGLEIIQNTSRGILKFCHSDCWCVTEICHVKSYLLNFNLEVSKLRSSSSSTIVGNSNKSTNPSKIFNEGLVLKLKRERIVWMLWTLPSFTHWRKHGIRQEDMLNTPHHMAQETILLTVYFRYL